MKKALLHDSEPGRICQVVNPGDEFEVHPSFRWVDVPDDTNESDKWDLENETVIKYNLLNDPHFVEHGYKVARGSAYGSFGDQLDMIYKEIKANGTLSIDGTWVSHIDSVKATIPKDDPAAVMAWNQAYIQQQLNGGGQP